MQHKKPEAMESLQGFRFETNKKNVLIFYKLLQKNKKKFYIKLLCNTLIALLSDINILFEKFFGDNLATKN